ncbi:MAG TPA: FtsX-like permease family protein, partial [Terriglobia bacterium]|nr:FtsX-like permease family protein [Terriglobia bacterium]
QQPPDIPYNGIGPAYFETMRIPLLEGRAFVDSDNESAPLVAIVNQTMARRFWPRQNPIGKRFSLKSASGPFIEVVGLARDGQSTWMLSPGAQPYFYLPLRQNFQSFLTLEVRSVASPQSLVPVVQQEIHKLDPDLPIMDVRAMRETVQGLAGFFVIRLAASLAGVMGILGLTLAVVGVYGVVSFAVDRRTHEIGIRMALGAERGDILKLALRQGVGLVMFGIVAGLLAAVAVTHAMAKLLMGVSTTDPVTYALVSTLLLVVALLASYIPARRAARVDPMVALRRE